MTGRHTREQLLAKVEIVAAPADRSCRDQSFGLPTGIYVAMATMFAGFFVLLGLAFRGGHMGLFLGVIFAFIAAFFGVPATFARVAAGKTRTRALDWLEFSDRGIMTANGHMNAREATTLVLLLPSVILFFGVAIAAITELV